VVKSEARIQESAPGSGSFAIPTVCLTRRDTVRARLVLLYAWLMFHDACLCRIGLGQLCGRLVRRWGAGF
jgi:hypothetical protein